MPPSSKQLHPGEAGAASCSVFCQRAVQAQPQHPKSSPQSVVTGTPHRGLDTQYERSGLLSVLWSGILWALDAASQLASLLP